MPRPAVHPGKVLAEELAELGVSPTELARQIDVPPNRISQIINNKRAITGDTALRLAHWFKTTPELWLSLQAAYDLRTAELAAGNAIRRLPTRAAVLKGLNREAISKKLNRTG
jgi:addiction module HigA family antidote